MFVCFHFKHHPPIVLFVLDIYTHGYGANYLGTIDLTGIITLKKNGSFPSTNYQFSIVLQLGVWVYELLLPPSIFHIPILTTRATRLRTVNSLQGIPCFSGSLHPHDDTISTDLIQWAIKRGHKSEKRMGQAGLRGAREGMGVDIIKTHWTNI